MSAEKSIVFQDGSGKELFRIPDGGFLKQTFGNGETNYALCRYVDEENMKLDGRSVRIRQFVKQMGRNGIDIAPMRR